MLFGAATGTVLGKSLGGYTDGQKDTFDGKPRPMVRFLLDEPTRDGDTHLTLEVTQTQYAQLLLGQRGNLSWWGEKLSDFAPTGECGEVSAPVEAQMEEEPTVQPAQPPEIAQSEPESAPPPHTESASEPVSERAASALPPPEKPRLEMDCPWCGKAMGVWRMNSPQYGAVIKRGVSWEFNVEKIKAFILSKERYGNDKICLTEGGKILLFVCEDCQRAVIDYKNEACDGSIWA